MKRWTAALVVLMIMGVLPFGGCGKKHDAQSAAGSSALGQVSGSSAGVKWSVPKRWTVQGDRPMRVATYTVPAAEGATETAECAVFYFGNDQGGNVEDNIQRWVGQFETSAPPAKAQKEINGMKVTLVQIAGAYLAPGGPMMASTGKKENFRLLGAIIEGPQGSVFFKFTGPAAAIAGAEGEFNAMTESLAKM